MTLQKAKDQIAKEYGYQSWESLRHCNSMNYGQWETFSDRAAELYAKEITDKAWEAAWDHCTQRVGKLENNTPVTAPDKSTYMKQLFPE